MSYGTGKARIFKEWDNRGKIKHRLFFGARAACGVTASALGCRSTDSVNNPADGPTGPLGVARAVTQTGIKKTAPQGGCHTGKQQI